MPGYFNTEYDKQQYKKTKQYEEDRNDRRRQELNVGTNSKRGSNNVLDEVLDDIIKRVMSDENEPPTGSMDPLLHNLSVAEDEEHLQHLAPTKPDNDWDHEEDERRRKEFNARIEEKWGRHVKKDPIVEVAEKVMAEERTTKHDGNANRHKPHALYVGKTVSGFFPDRSFQRAQKPVDLRIPIIRPPTEMERLRERYGVEPSVLWYSAFGPHPHFERPVPDSYWNNMKRLYPPEQYDPLARLKIPKGSHEWIDPTELVFSLIRAAQSGYRWGKPYIRRGARYASRYGREALRQGLRILQSVPRIPLVP